MGNKKILSPWSKAVRKAMIDQDMDMDMVDIANKFKWTRQYDTAIVNGGMYHPEAVARVSLLFGIDIPSEKSTLARKVKSEAKNELSE